MVKVRTSTDDRGQRALLSSAPCTVCGGVSRLYGIEPHPTSISDQIFTYECSQCGENFARVVSQSRQPIEEFNAVHKIS